MQTTLHTYRENIMIKNIARRDMLKMGMAATVCAAAGVLAHSSNAEAKEEKRLLKAGIITDLHKTTKADITTRVYSASMDKLKVFMDTMKKEKPAFIIELGDFVDTLSPETDPAANLRDIETLFTSFDGPAYHVLGNHDFDNLKRNDFLSGIINTGIEKGKTYYSYDAQGIHCIVLDADYTPKNFRPYDMNTPEDTFWTWVDTIIPPQEMEWLKNDLQKTDKPVLVFSHQTLDRVDEQDHNIKNASAVRTILEESGKVLAVISGHDHQGGYSNIKGIHYVVLNGNVGVNDYRTWDVTSTEKGRDIHKDNQFCLLEVGKKGKTYTLSIKGYGRQPSYRLERIL